MAKAFGLVMHDLSTLLMSSDESLRSAQKLARTVSERYIVQWCDGAISTDGTPNMDATIHYYDISALARGMRQSTGELLSIIDELAVNNWRERTGATPPARPSWRVGIIPRFKQTTIGFLKDSVTS